MDLYDKLEKISGPSDKHKEPKGFMERPHKTAEFKMGDDINHIYDLVMSRFPDRKQLKFILERDYHRRVMTQRAARGEPV